MTSIQVDKENSSGFSENEYKLMNVWESASLPHNVIFSERKRRLAALSELNAESKYSPSKCCAVTPMPLHEELLVMMMWLALFSLVLFGPIVVVFLLYFKPKIAIAIIVVGFSISRIKVPFVPNSCNHYLATLNLKYFSYRAIWKTSQPAGCYIGMLSLDILEKYVVIALVLMIRSSATTWTFPIRWFIRNIWNASIRWILWSRRCCISNS